VRKLLLSWAVNTVVLLIVSLLLGSKMEYEGFLSLAAAAAVIGVSNRILAPVINFFTCPIYLLTLGLSRFLVTGLLILLAGWLVKGFQVSGYFWAVVAAVLISVTTGILEELLKGGS